MHTLKIYLCVQCMYVCMYVCVCDVTLIVGSITRLVSQAIQVLVNEMIARNVQICVVVDSGLWSVYVCVCVCARARACVHAVCVIAVPFSCGWVLLILVTFFAAKFRCRYQIVGLIFINLEICVCDGVSEIVYS